MKKNRKTPPRHPFRRVVGIDYKSLLNLLCNKYLDYKNVYEVEHNNPAPPFEIWLCDLQEENSLKREKEKNVLKRKIAVCIDEAIVTVFHTYHLEHPNADVPFYDFVKGVIQND